jgi:hypothetical protein
VRHNLFKLTVSVLLFIAVGLGVPTATFASGPVTYLNVSSSKFQEDPPCCDGGQDQWANQPATMAPATSPRLARAVVGEPWSLSVVQFPQEKCNWCGASAARSIDLYLGADFSQTTLASLGGAGLNPPKWCACGTNTSPCKGVTDLATLLTQTSGRTYRKYSYASQIGSSTALSSTIWDSLYWGNQPVAMNTFEPAGHLSYNFHSSTESSTTNIDIGHYIVVRGVSYGILNFVDPAGNDNAVLGWGKTVPYFDASAASMVQYMPGSYGIYR